MKKEQNIFNSKFGAYKMLLDKLENITALLRDECEIYDCKLETCPVYNEKKTILGYAYMGKIKFTQDGNFESEAEEEMSHGGYTVLFRYFLSRDAKTPTAKKKAKTLEKEVWFLEKVL